MAVEHVGLFFVAKKGGALRFIVDARASNRHFLRPPAGLLLTGEGLCLVEFQGAPEDAQNWFVGSAGDSEYVSSDAHSWLAARCSRIRSWLFGENDQPETVCTRFLDVPCSYNTSNVVFRGRCSSVKMSQTTARSRRVLILFFSFAVTTPHRCSVADKAWDRLVSAGRMLTIFGFWHCTNVHLARLIASVTRAGLDVHDTCTLPAEVQMFSIMMCDQPTRIEVERGERIARIRSVAWTIFARRRVSGRAMELVNGHESFLALSNRGALSILHASFKFAGPLCSYRSDGPARVQGTE